MRLSVITPTTGKLSLDRLIESINKQSFVEHIFHFLLWDDYRSEGAKSPESYNSNNRLSIVLPKGSGKNGSAPGSALRAVGLMAAQTEWVTFADDDVFWENNHAETMINALNTQNANWGYCLRKIWSSAGECLGIDRFESVGDSPTRKVPYEMCDNNCMVFKRELGVLAAQLYRETQEYNDDRLMYGFLKQNAGSPYTSHLPTTNHICPDKLITFFRVNCDKK